LWRWRRCIIGFGLVAGGADSCSAPTGVIFCAVLFGILGLWAGNSPTYFRICRRNACLQCNDPWPFATRRCLKSIGERYVSDSDIPVSRASLPSCLAMRKHIARQRPACLPPPPNLVLMQHPSLSFCNDPRSQIVTIRARNPYSPRVVTMSAHELHRSPAESSQ
jgi:hypothetical protein